MTVEDIKKHVEEGRRDATALTQYIVNTKDQTKDSIRSSFKAFGLVELSCTTRVTRVCSGLELLRKFAFSDP